MPYFSGKEYTLLLVLLTLPNWAYCFSPDSATDTHWASPMGGDRVGGSQTLSHVTFWVRLRHVPAEQPQLESTQPIFGSCWHWCNMARWPQHELSLQPQAYVSNWLLTTSTHCHLKLVNQLIISPMSPSKTDRQTDRQKHTHTCYSSCDMDLSNILLANQAQNQELPILHSWHSKMCQIYLLTTLLPKCISNSYRPFQFHRHFLCSLLTHPS